MQIRSSLRTASIDSRLRVPAAIAAAWAVVSIAAAAQTVALVRLHGSGNLLGAIASRLSILPLWAIATPLILRSARRLPVVLGNRFSAGALSAHLALGSAFIVLSNIAVRIPSAAGAAGAEGAVAWLIHSTMQGVAEFYPAAIIVYGVIVAIGHVVPRRDLSEPASDAIALPLAAVAQDSPLESPAAEPAAEPATEPAAPTPLDGHLTVRQWNRVHLVPIDDIDWVEAEDNYVVVHAASRRYRSRERISDIESQLDQRRFVRVHRSSIVHVAKIREVQPLTHGDHAVILRDGTVLRVARSRRRALCDALGLEL